MAVFYIVDYRDEPVLRMAASLSATTILRFPFKTFNVRSLKMIVVGTNESF